MIKFYLIAVVRDLLRQSSDAAKLDPTPVFSSLFPVPFYK
ncbi:hypothetical protein PL9214520189 [Planktothrix tepida PCC 9214]|uniref:Uncharacterized protein n=1 Tax=Planktothrix tepida PCC 9214 TaxID=671072 RepID=A0A1J1LNS4_9CYAN|nr:hypothetical protein PL9214520189 [Planktothrix tepida PCC 9214]